jgi:hypothetical protein
MAEKEKREAKVTSALTSESIKVIAESAGIGGLPDNTACFLADDITYRLRQMAQVIIEMLLKNKYIKKWFYEVLCYVI